MPRLSGIFVLIVAALLNFSAVLAQEGDPDWRSIAGQAERIVQREDSTLFTLTKLRNEMIVWRDKFASEKELNAGRLQTVDAQIAALGPLPEDGEANELTTRRSELNKQREELFAPAALAHEAFAQADGLLREVDAKIRSKNTQALTTRNPTPLNPVYWGSAFSNLGSGLTDIFSDIGSSTRTATSSTRAQGLLPLSLVFALAGLWLLLRGRRSTDRWAGDVMIARSDWLPLQSFGISVIGLFLPLAGLCLVAWSILRLNVVGDAMETFIVALALAGLIILVARWLTLRFFPKFEEQGPLQYDVAVRDQLRRLSFLLGLGLAAIVIIESVMSLTDAEAVSVGVLLLPVDVLMAFVLFRFGKLLRTAPLSARATPGAGRTRRFVGLLAMGVAIATPLLTAAGYSAASKALFAPSVLTLALLALVMLLQRLVATGWSLRLGQGENEHGPLAPVLIAAALFVVALPILALIWGAQVSDLSEWWSKFQTGFTFGNTTLSPTDFITFVIIFVVGYLLTRFIQGMLRGSVLPRTRLDLGGQNAIVAGVGYVGIILSAVVAITSAGIDLSNLAIVAGALSVGIGFGLQNIVSNFVSGIILLIERPVSEGDWIEVNGQMGYVKKISVRSTQIETFDRTDVIVPNADLVSGQVTNWTRGNSVGRLIIPVGVAYGTDVDKVMDILKDIAMSHPMVLHNPMPSVIFQNFGASSLDFEIRAILRDVNFMLSVKSEINLEISRRFDEAGIEIPFPQQDVWLRTPIAQGDTE